MIVIYGKGVVGQAIATLCTQKNIDYEIRDDLDKNLDFSQYKAIIPSPGVPSTHAVYQTDKVMAELDFAYQFLPEKSTIIAITGTDGKSTTTHMLYSILKKYYFGKRKVYISGNFAIPLSQTVAEILENGDKNPIIVVEISSFMAYFIGKSHLKAFSPDYTIFTNLKADHLNWHRDLQEYVDAKMNLVHHTKQKSLLNAEILDFIAQKNLSVNLPENIRLFSDNPEKTPKDWTNGEEIAVSGRRKYHLSETKFSGMHNAMNILSVTLVANEMKICSKQTKKILAKIGGLPHRLEVIGEKNGVIFVEDSKSTSSQSLEAALGAFGSQKNLLLIAGGSDKGDIFEHLEEKFSQRVKAVACLGATKKHFVDLAQKCDIPLLETDNLSEATNWLWKQSEKGDVLILSPGCASFGLFKDYLDRANQFRESIKNLS